MSDQQVIDMLTDVSSQRILFMEPHLQQGLGLDSTDSLDSMLMGLLELNTE
jgi:hypothetical protein